MPIRKTKTKEIEKSNYAIYIIASLIIVVVAVGLIGYWSGFRGEQSPEVEPSSSIDLLTEVGELINLPVNEEPTIATVSNLEALQGQEFFRNAEVGDKVLIYAEAKKAILYSPTKKKIIEVAPLNIPNINE